MSNLINWKKGPVSLHRHKDPLRALQNELDNVIGDFYNSFETAKLPPDAFETLAINPSIDIIDAKDFFKIEAEMPGIAEEDIHVSIDNGILTIKAAKEKSSKNKDKH